MPAGSIELVSMSEYARRRGCTEAAVRRAVRDGRISLMDGRVDPVAADAQWARNTRVRAGSRPADDVNLRAPGAAPPATGGDEPPVEDYYLVKARRERAEADLAELKLAELRGELVRVADVRAAYAKRAAGLREAILQLPARLSAQLAAESDQAKCHDLLQADLHGILAQLVEP
jgi:hypothetical protein